MEMEFREKYPEIATALEEYLHELCMEYELTPTGPLHDVVEWILSEFFVKDNKYKNLLKNPE